MKTVFSLGLLLVTLASARAQVFRPEAVNGAVLGGIAGAMIGHNSGDLRHNGWKGAAIGAGAGLILGEAWGNARASRAVTSVSVEAPRSGYGYRGDYPASIYIGYQRGYGHHAPHYSYGRHRHFGYRGYGYRSGGYYGGSFGSVYGYSPSYRYYGGYGDGYPYFGSVSSYGGSAAANGLLLGALAGGIVGHNSGELHHDAWRGSAWGAGLGWLLGSVADARRRAVAYEAQPVAVQAAPVAQAAPVVAPAPAASAGSSSAMSAANQLFGRN